MVKTSAVENQTAAWLGALRSRLRPAFTQPFVPGGHDFLHVERMIAMGPRIREHLSFDLEEFTAAAWLHNLDRCSRLSQKIKDLATQYGKEHGKELEEIFKEAGPDQEDVNAYLEVRGLELFCFQQLEGSPFGMEARNRIVDAVLQHPKKDDDVEHDSTLLTAIRIADKAETLGALRVTMIAGHKGSLLLLYNPEKPFGYESTAEISLQTLYASYFRVLEWYRMLPFDWARALIPDDNFRFFINFVRQFGKEISEATGIENAVEADIRRALGPHYERWR